tara:strand:+ start:553 stop:735 length:183 start_codon:yes stop_codon:yes gene_type:complete
MKKEIIKNEFGLFELHIDNELCLVKKSKKEINQFLEETNRQSFLQQDISEHSIFKIKDNS